MKDASHVYERENNHRISDEPCDGIFSVGIFRRYKNWIHARLAYCVVENLRLGLACGVDHVLAGWKADWGSCRKGRKKVAVVKVVVKATTIDPCDQFGSHDRRSFIRQFFGLA
ncbi:MAG: hypothetical protein ABJL99_21695 [Aliishimia sp.]